MRIALGLAMRGLGTTAPNPSVGAVIVEEASGEIIARGWTQPGGRPHAETIALARAGARARGATMYVTLEPCSHFGATPPCADAVIAAGVRRVVASIRDPDPRVAGRGLARLQSAGVEVMAGVLAREADWIARGHILRTTERRPFTQLKLALGPSGEVPRGQQGQPVWVTGDEARAEGHLLRAMSDAILVGRATIRDDNPALTCRLPGLQGRSPLRAVLARTLDIPPDSNLVATARQVPVIVFCAPDAPPDRRAMLEAAGCVVTSVREVQGALWLPAVAEELVARGVTRLLVEGGATVWRSFAQSSLVDEVVVFRSGGGSRETAETTSPLSAYLPGLEMSLVARRVLGSDDMITFRRTGPVSTGQ